MSTHAAAGSTTTLDRWVLRVAGAFVPVSLALSQRRSANRPRFAAFVGANPSQTSVTGSYPFAMAFRRLGVGSGAALRPPAR